MKSSSNEVLAELTEANLIADYNDFSRLGSALLRGDSKEQILFMPEVERWPGLFRWLQERL